MITKHRFRLKWSKYNAKGVTVHANFQSSNYKSKPNFGAGNFAF